MQIKFEDSIVALYMSDFPTAVESQDKSAENNSDRVTSIFTSVKKDIVNMSKRGYARAVMCLTDDDVQSPFIGEMVFQGLNELGYHVEELIRTDDHVYYYVKWDDINE